MWQQPKYNMSSDRTIQCTQNRDLCFFFFFSIKYLKEEGFYFHRLLSYIVYLFCAKFHIMRCWRPVPVTFSTIFCFSNVKSLVCSSINRTVIFLNACKIPAKRPVLGVLVWTRCLGLYDWRESPLIELTFPK